MQETNTKQQILELLKEKNYGLTIEEVSCELKISRSTGSKYLAVLEAERKVVIRSIGKAKLHYLLGNYNGSNGHLPAGGTPIDNGIAVILLALLLFFAYAPASTSAYQNYFLLSTDKGAYGINTDVYLYISGPTNTAFTVKIYGPDDVLLSRKTDKTSGMGSAYMHYTGFSVPGAYRAELEYAGGNIVKASFSVAGPGTEVCENCKPRTITTTSTTYETTNVIQTTSTASSMPVTSAPAVTTGSSAGTTTTTAPTTTPAPYAGRQEGISETGKIAEEPANTLSPKAKDINITKKDVGRSFRLGGSPRFKFKTNTGNVGALSGPKDLKALIHDSEDRIVGIEAEVNQTPDGDYVVSLPDTRAIRPGAYKVSLDTGVYGDTTPAVQNFLWGLVSVNTKKSTYKPGEKAEFIIVVLNEEGRGLCDTDVWLNVTSPDGTVTALSKQDGTILVGDECGIYTASYTVESDGGYIVNASARVGETQVGTEYVENPGADETEPRGDTVPLMEPLIASFDTSFQAAESYPYDIIRTADSKIDPSRRDEFQVRVDLESFAGATDVTVRERVPSAFEVSTDGEVLEVGDEKILSWKKSFSGGASYVNYSYSVPHEWPMLYELGPLEISGDGGNYTEARPWYVAVDPVIGITGMAVYQLSSQARVPACMNWSEGLWNAQGNASNVSNTIQWVVLKDNPVREEKILATLDSASNVLVQIWNTNHTWSVPFNMTQKESNNTKRGLDVAVEQVSGNAFVFYNNGSAGMVAYRVWNGSSWSKETNLTYNASTPAKAEWIKTASVKGTNRIMVVVQTENTTTYPDIYAIPWDGSNWLTPFNLEDQAKQTATECFDTAFMETSQNALVAWGDQALATPSYRNYTYGKGWSAEAQATTVGTASIVGVRLAPMPGSDRIMMCILEAGTGNDIHCQEWSGIAMRTAAGVDTSIQLNAGRRNYDVEANGNTSGYVLLYGDSGTNYFSQAYCSSLANCQAGTWTAISLWPGTAIGTSTAWGQLYYTPNKTGEFVALMQGNAAGNGWYKGRFACNASACAVRETPNSLGAASSVAYESAMFAVDMYQAPYQTNLTPWDETNMTMYYANKTIYINQSILFFANYTNMTGTPVNSTYASDANCQISIYNVTKWTSWSAMTFNSTKSLYQYNLTGGLYYPGTYQWNVTCNATGYAYHQGLSSVFINNTMPTAVIDWPKSTDWIARWNSSTSLRCNASDLEDPVTSLKMTFQWDASSGYSSLTAPAVNGSTATNPFVTNFSAATDAECSAANIGATGRCYYQCYANDSLNGTSSVVQNSFGIDGEAPTGYSAGIQGYAEESWLTGSSYTLQCPGATDPNSGSGVSSYDYEYTSADDCLSGWGAITGCTDIAGNCAWNTPPANEAGLCVRCRATDNVSNNGTWDAAHYAGTDNTPPGTCLMTRPLAFYNITTSTYTLASDESDAGAGIRNVTFQYYNDSWRTACVGTDNALSYNCSWTVPVGIEDWRNISIEAVCYDNVSLSTTSTNVSNITIDAVNTNPSCVVTYPNGGENVSGSIIINASASETDPSDYVNNVSFNYSADGGSTWTQIGTNTTSSLTAYGLAWDTSALNGNKFEIRCIATDTRNGYGIDDSNQNFTVDNAAPNGYSTGIAGYAKDSWLTGSSYTVQCSGATDNGGSGIANYKYEYTSADDCLTGWGAISGCTDTAGDCSWNTPPANEAGFCVRCRATDSAGNNGTWDSAHYAGTDNTPPGTCLMTRPLAFYNITTSTYTLASDESDAGAGIRNVTFQYFNGTWQTACVGTSNAQSYNCSWTLPSGIEDWKNISIEAICYDNVSLNTTSTNVSNITIDAVNTNPSCVVTYPNGGENVSGAIALAATASETDPTDYVNNLSFNYSADGGSTWTQIGTNTTSGFTAYGIAWDTSALNGKNFEIRCTAADTRNGYGSDDSDQNFTVDNAAPTGYSTGISGYARETWLTGSSYTVECSGATDNGGSGVASYDYEYTSADDCLSGWGAISGCTDATGDCAWNTPPANEASFCVRCRATDNVFNNGAWDSAHYAGTDNTPPGTCIMTRPLAFYNITTSTYTLASDESDAGSGIRNVTFQYFNGTWQTACVGTSNAQSYNCSWTLPSGIEDWKNISIEAVCYDNASLSTTSTNVSNITVDAVNTNPSCTVTYPNGGENILGTVIATATASETDPTDYVNNLSFNYSADGGSTWTQIGTNTTSGLTAYNWAWDTSALNGNKFEIRCSATDTRNGYGSDDSNQNFTVDNAAPNGYSTGISGFARDSWLAASPYTVQCTGATDNGGSGVASYDYEYTSADDCLSGWTAISGCTDAAGDCAWNTPPANEAGVCVRCRATDSAGNNGTWDSAHYAGLDNTPPSTCAMTRPLAFYNITYSTYTLASDESDPTSGIRNVTFQYYDGNAWQTACAGTDNAQSYNCSWNVPAGIEDWRNISIKAICFNNASLSAESLNVSNLAIDAVNVNPTCSVTYPNGGENMTGSFVITALANETDPSDHVNNVSFNYSLDGGVSWSALGTNDTQGLGYYSMAWDPAGISSSRAEVRCVAKDTRGGLGLDDSDANFTIDTVPPTLSLASINQTLIGTSQRICLNITVSDLGVDSVWAEIDVPSPGLDRNISLLDDGSGCDKAASDGVYSAEYTSSYEDMYNWTWAYANDTLGNLNYTKIGLNWSVSSTAYMNTGMERPVQDLKVNESTSSRSYNYTQGCNVSCGIGGTSCDSVVLHAQYKPLAWEDIATSTTEIINSVDNYSCGTLSPGQTCRYNFTITPANNTGGDSWQIRCRATSTTAAQDNSAIVTLTINTMPDVSWTYPASDGQWLHGVEDLGASATDADGTIAAYLFELDNNSAFTSPVTLCSTSDPSCAFDTNAQTECIQNDNTKCFLRVTAIDNDGGTNSTARIFGIDDVGPSSSLDRPPNYENISANSYKVNATVSDQGIGTLSAVSFEYRPDPSAAWSTACTDADTAVPFECVWSLSGLADGSTYEVRVRSNDTFGNIAYDTHTGITLDRTVPSIILDKPVDHNTTIQSSVDFNYTVVDAVAATLNCSIYVDAVLKGTNSSTKNNTISNFTVAGIAEGVHSWYVNCSDYSGNRNKSDVRSFTADHTNPAWNSQNQTINGIYATVAHRGDIINLSTNWTDNIMLDSAFLSTNETGAWQNKSGVYNSPQQLFGTVNQSVFPWTTASIAPGTGVAWMIYANDTAGNMNNTALMNYTVWGYSKVSALTLSPSTVNQSGQTAVLCKVVDNVTGAPIANYPVSFYNSTKLMGINKTGSDGWSAWNYSINSTGTEQITCNITHNDTLYYNISNDNQMQDYLTIQQTGSPIFYRIISDPCEMGTYCRAGVLVYNPNPTTIHVKNVTDRWSTDYVSTIRQCCTPDGCNVNYCGESPGGTVFFKNQSAWNISAYSYQIFWYEMGNTNAAGTPNLTANVTTAEWPLVSVTRPSVRIINTVACAWTSWSTNKTTFDTNSSAPSILHVDAGSTTKFTVRLTEYCGQRSLAVTNNLVVTVPVGWTYVTSSANWTSNNAGCIYAAATRQIKCILPATILNAYNNISFNLTAPSAIGAYNFTTLVNGTDAGAIHSDNNTHMVLVRDYSAPNALNNGSSNSSYHRGTPINLYANWTDNYKLDGAVLSTNESGTWENKTGIYGSPKDLGMVNNSWSNYTWLNDTLPLGTQVFWRIYANDSTGNTNGTVVRNFTVWSYAASVTSLDKSSILKYNPVNVYCFVGDTFNGSGIQNYPVTVYSNTTLLANGSTTNGWFNVTYIPEIYGAVRITCNISDNATLFYNASSSAYYALQINDSYKFNLTVTNSTNNSFLGSTITVYGSDGSTLASGPSNISVGLEMNKEYDIGISVPVNGTTWMNAVIRRLNLSNNYTLRPQVVTDYGSTIPANISRLTTLFAINDSFIVYNHTELYIPRGDQDDIVSIMHCQDWSFLPPNCPAWDMYEPEDYNMQENDTHIWFNVTHFTSYGGGAGNPIPNATTVKIYDVTGQADTHTGGTLIGSGLNTTFYFLKRVPKMYRAEFTVRNDGLAKWTIAAGDDVHHENLNSAWPINNRTDIWYNLGGTNYYSGNWSGGRVVWNMSLGGQLNKGSTMTFYYVFNMTSSDTEVYNTYFLCNDTSSKSGSYDYDKYNITRLGYFEFQLALPPQIPGLGNASNNTGLTAYMIGANRTFMVNATVYCRDGYCGMVNGTLRYNKTSANPDTQVNTTLKDKPFYVMDGVNPKNCGNNPMKTDDYCNATWMVNATDVMHSIHKLDVQFLSNYSLSNDTADVSIEVTKVLIVDLSWDVANFGVCNPMSYGNPALLNSQGYNITIDNNSNDVDGLYIKGTDLGPVNVSVLNGITYGIGVGNMTWHYADNYSNSMRLTNQYYLMNQSLPTSTVIRNYYWIDIPRGQYTQDYAGKLYIMANASV